MQNQVIADIDIEGQKIEHYSSVFISQKFNEHHTFSIRIKYDALEKQGSFSLSNAQKLIGKTATIKLLDANTLDTSYEFHGLVCEITVDQADNFTSDLIINGYSPTILLETGPNFNSFYQKNLEDIAGSLTTSLSQVNINPQYKTEITYICQYRESAFHFLNRLSAHFGEWFYYDGQQLLFGKPANSPNVEVTYGVDVHNMQMKLRILPLKFTGYSYNSKEDSFITSDAPSGVDGLDQYGSYVLKESNNIYSEPVSFPVKQRIETKSDLDAFIKQQKIAMAADLEVLSATSDNPTICIGAIADVKVSVLAETGFNKQDGGKFLVTSVDHYITANGKYYNNFEGIPSAIDVLPVRNFIVPSAEPQIATVTDNKDPDNTGRVRVQMLWQQASGEMTDWLRVMAPDAGGDKNRGFVFIPEINDQVLICFRYNDPDRPFVMGSLFTGKTGAGGGDDNKTKSITVLSGSTVIFKDKAISIIDADEKSKILIDGDGKIDVNSSESITLTTGDSSITMKKDGTIEIKGKKITVEADTIEGKANQEMKLSGSSSGVSVKGMKIELTADTDMKIKGLSTAVEGSAEAKLKGVNTSVEGNAQLDLKGGALASLSAALVKIN